jgi:ankyrin repeat protein
MASHSTANMEHLLQAAFRYLEKGNASGLQSILKEYPEIVHMRERGEGRGLIHDAAESGLVDSVALLLEFGADPNMREGKRFEEENRVEYVPGYTPLHCAARSGHEEVAGLLLSRGAVSDAADHCDGTPLHGVRSPKIAEMLLEAGADPDAICWLRYADEILGWHFAGSPLHTAGDDVALIRTLVSHGARVDAADHITRRTALHYAAARGSTVAVKALLELGANPNAMCELENYGIQSRMTPLHYAAQQGHKDVVQALLGSGAQAYLLGGRGSESAADLAREAGHEEIVALLAEAKLTSCFKLKDC